MEAVLPGAVLPVSIARSRRPSPVSCSLSKPLSIRSAAWDSTPSCPCLPRPSSIAGTADSWTGSPTSLRICWLRCLSTICSAAPMRRRWSWCGTPYSTKDPLLSKGGSYRTIFPRRYISTLLCIDTPYKEASHVYP